jgi:hypothetical protein
MLHFYLFGASCEFEGEVMVIMVVLQLRQGNPPRDEPALSL